jgi:hypothetical protein
MESFWQDVRYGARILIRTPAIYRSRRPYPLRWESEQNTAIFTVINSDPVCVRFRTTIPIDSSRSGKATPRGNWSGPG